MAYNLILSIFFGLKNSNLKMAGEGLKVTPCKICNIGGN